MLILAIVYSLDIQVKRSMFNTTQQYKGLNARFCDLILRILALKGIKVSYLTISSCVRRVCRDIEHSGSLENKKEAQPHECSPSAQYLNTRTAEA